MESSDSNKRLKTSSGAPLRTGSSSLSSSGLSGAARLPAYHPPAVTTPSSSSIGGAGSRGGSSG
ncbi:hypothetical protein Slin15195_G107740 [Septoria linicola]|uniref:Uncharacterized protein n=1 Tax=Septoria linicola TaxID=215465 RepID=A0A9Q9AYH7_9PEZI|nr:hypothetical protein Slin14017_G106040 [Septoria linicola]USW57455.1 hypothetical protein Slin15195_G107740 [Septoria linicola]